MLDHVRSTRPTPFFAPRFLIARWEKTEARLSFGGFEITIGPVTEDALRDARPWREACPVEVALHRAVTPIRKTSSEGMGPDRWTESLDGWGGLVQTGWQGLGKEPPPAHVVDLIAKAYPLPRTFREALDEVTYWAWRTTMSLMSLGYGETPFGAVDDPFGGDEGLDLTVLIRLELLRPLVLYELSSVLLAEILTRLQIYGEMDQKDPRIEAAVVRDLQDLAWLTTDVLRHTRARAAAPAAKKGPARKGRRRGCQNPRVAELLSQTPRQTDRAIGRLLGISQSTVGTQRRRMIADGRIDPNEAAEVVRGNAKRPYRMKPRTGGAKAVTPKPAERDAVTASPVPKAVVASEPQASPGAAPASGVPSGPVVGKTANKAGSSPSAVDSFPLFTWIEKQED